MKIIFLILLIFLNFESNSQKDLSGKLGWASLTVVDKDAQYPGLEEDYNKFIYKNMNYPQITASYKIYGIVRAEFMVDEEGNISEIVVSKKLDTSTSLEIIKLIKKMPKWKPAYKEGKPIKSFTQLSINFNKYSYNTNNKFEDKELKMSKDEFIDFSFESEDPILNFLYIKNGGDVHVDNKNAILEYMNSIENCNSGDKYHFFYAQSPKGYIRRNYLITIK